MRLRFFAQGLAVYKPGVRCRSSRFFIGGANGRSWRLPRDRRSAWWRLLQMLLAPLHVAMVLVAPLHPPVYQQQPTITMWAESADGDLGDHDIYGFEEVNLPPLPNGQHITLREMEQPEHDPTSGENDIDDLSADDDASAAMWRKIERCDFCLAKFGTRKRLSTCQVIAVNLTNHFRFAWQTWPTSRKTAMTRRTATARSPASVARSGPRQPQCAIGSPITLTTSADRVCSS